MNKIKVSCAIASVALTGFAVNSVAASAYFADELRGLSFGTSQKSIPNLVREHLLKQSVRNGLHYFSRSGDDLHYRGAPLTDILYGFRNGKLEIVELWTVDKCIHATLRHALEARFGEAKYYAFDNNAWRQKEAECSLMDPLLCETYKFEGFPNDANAKGIVGWYTRYSAIGHQTEFCRDRVRFSRSPRTRAEHEKAIKEEKDLLKQLFKMSH